MKAILITTRLLEGYTRHYLRESDETKVVILNHKQNETN